MDSDQISDKEKVGFGHWSVGGLFSYSIKLKVRIASDFVMHAPPGEFNEVFNDVRLLLGNDQLLKDGCAPAFANYNKDQFMAVKLDQTDKMTLITAYNDLGGGRFYDPKSCKSFRFDHLRREATDIQPYEATEPKAEPWRKTLQQAADSYMDNHYLGSGVCTVFGRVDQANALPALTLCIESHKFQPKNYWNGRWRSQWAVVLTEKQAELKGIIKVQVHYYEDGNVQLVSSKEITRKVTVSQEPENTAKEIINIIEEEESAYQSAVNENYQAMSDTTFKALRRQLPVTRTKVDWMKIQSYRVGQEINKPII